MRDGWEIKKLGEVCDFQGGSQPPKEEWVSEPQDGYVRMLQIRDFTQSRSFDIEYVKISNRLKYCKEDDVLLGRYGASVGKVLTGLSGAYNVAIMKTIPNYSVLCNRFFKYFLQSPSFQTFLLQASTMRAAQAGFSKEDIQDYPIPVPPLTEQERIVAELDCLSSIIEKKKQQLKEYDTLAQSIFYDMFGDPITNEKGLPIQQLGDFATSVTYGTSSPANEGGKFIYLRMNNLTYDGYLDLNDVKTTDVPDKDLDKYVVRKGDILFNRTNSRDLVGKTALFDLDNEMVIAGYIIRVRVDEEKMLPVYVVRYMNTSFMKSYYYNLCKGAVNQANINSKELKAMPLPVPSLTLQQEFAKKIEAIEKQKELIKQSLVETETLFNSRMDYYFN